MASRVFTDADLFRRIAAFQRGLPLPLYDFWRAHKPAYMSIQLTPQTTTTLVQKLVEHGTPALLDVATRATFACRRGWGDGVKPEVEALSLRDVATIALFLNRPIILEWALTTKNAALGPNVTAAWRDAITRRAANGDTRILDVLKRHVPLPTRKLNALVASVSDSIQHVSMMRWFVEEISEVQIPPAMVKFAIDRGSLEMLELLHANGLTTCDSSVFSNAVRAPRRDVLAFLVDHYAGSLDEYSAMDLITHPDDEVQHLAARIAERLQDACATWISEDRNDSRLAQVQTWATNGLISPRWPISIDSTAGNGNIETVRLLHDNGVATATTEAMDQAAENGHWELVAFLHRHRSEGCTTRTMDAAIQQGQLDQVMFLHENRTERYSREAAQHAASNRSITTVRFLHLHTNATFSPTVMDKAAALGNLAVVKFLHENRSEGCTTNAMDDAAACGHLAVVRFLYDHRTEGCTFAAVHGALIGGFLPVVRFLFDKYRDLFEQHGMDASLVARAVRLTIQRDQLPLAEFLFDHFPHLFTGELLPDVLLGGAFDIYTRLQDLDPDSAESVISSALFEAGRSKRLQTIRFVVDVLGRRDLAYRAVDGAVKASTCGPHWLRTVVMVAGPTSCRLSAVRAGVPSSANIASFDLGSPQLETLKYLIRVCCEPDAKQAAIEAADARRFATWANALRQWNPRLDAPDPFGALPLHPFLVDPRVKAWAIERLFDCMPFIPDPYRRVQAPLSWAIQAVYKHDLPMLEVIRETTPAPWHAHAAHSHATGAEMAASALSFDGARAAAIRVGSLEILQWLMENVDLPVEPTLLEEAEGYSQLEIAQWLREHHPDGCESVYLRESGVANTVTDSALSASGDGPETKTTV